jgi:branched-chain amino acid transport system substrate-binding protein
MRTNLKMRHLLLVAALLLGACGGGDDDDGGSAPDDAGGTGSTVPAPTGTPITVGSLCDRSGATQLIGVIYCPAFLDYIDMVNERQGGVDGHPIEVVDIDHGYEVPKAVAGYEQVRQQGAVAVLCQGTPIASALNESVTRDKVPCLTPGFGIAGAGDPTAYPYQFPIAASYYSQGAAAIDFALTQLEGQDEPKIAYLYFDNPAGKEPLPVLEALADSEGFELRTFAVPAPGLDMAAQVTDIVQRFEADFVVTHLFGRAPSVSIKAFKEAGYPLDSVVSLVWGSSEADIEAAGGFALAEGYHTLQFTGVGQDYDPIRDIIAMYEARGEDPPSALSDQSVYYNRGVFTAALLVEGIRHAVELGEPVTGETVKAGLEAIDAYEAGGLAPPLTISATDHEGGGYTRVYKVEDGELQPVTDWDNPHHDVVLEVVAAG